MSAARRKTDARGPSGEQLLSVAEIARLAAAGIKYPWPVRPYLTMLDEAERLKQERDDAQRRLLVEAQQVVFWKQRAHQLEVTLREETAAVVTWLKATHDRACLDCLCYDNAARAIEAGEHRPNEEE